MTTATQVSGVRELLPRFDAFVLDQWGVLHEGNALYPQVRAALDLLRDNGKQIVVLTNSSKSAHRNIHRLAARFALPVDTYDHLVSSADLLREHLQTLSTATPALRRVLVVADEGDEVLLDGLDLETVTDPTEAEAIVLLSVVPGTGLAEAEATGWVAEGVRRGLPLFCPSADVHSVRPDGVVNGMSALVAEYLRLGGAVVNFGKPGPRAHGRCTELLGDVPGERIVMVGDQLASDVHGAQRVGWSGALVRTGAGAHSATYGPTAHIVPDFVLPSLRP